MSDGSKTLTTGRGQGGAWAAADARKAYNVARWSEGYFDVGDHGHLIARPDAGRPKTTVDLHALALKLAGEGLQLPVLVRFTDILRDRVNRLTDTFAEAIKDLGYQGHYTAVYPIKVNQQADVVEAIVRAGGDRVGLESGSKPELAAVLGLATPGCIVVCNGYKDRAYIRRALIGQLMGHRVYIVVEKLSELPLLIEESAALGVAPMIGLRLRLSAEFSSTQQNTGGEKSKFGLTTPQVLEAIELLRAAGQLDAVKMIHFHIGSQVANVQDIGRALHEAGRMYVDLRRLGAPVTMVDVGGGLAVDYDGTHSRSFCSMNYSLREYARNIIRPLQEVCAECGEPEPDLISESGRALTAHHAVLITSVIDEETIDETPIEPPAADAPQVLRELHALFAGNGPIYATANTAEALHESEHLLAEVHEQYGHGLLNLTQRAWAERAYYAIARDALPKLDPAVRVQREMFDALREKLSSKYFCNFSVFQSVPDAWAIEQVFPILPIHRLDERPTVRARLCDLTCDSDGRLDRYVEHEGLMSTLALHALRPDEPYMLGIFMVGAYQEILGDIHNLFGDTNAVNVVLDDNEPGGWRLHGAQHGDRTDELLRYVHLEPEALAGVYRRKLAAAGLPVARSGALLAELEAGLYGYTYLS